MRNRPMVGWSTSAIMSRAATCGSATILSMELTEVQGTPSALSRSTQSSTVRVVNTSASIGISVVRFAARRLESAKRSSSAHCGRSIARHTPCHMRGVKAATTTQSSFAWKA